MKLCRTYKDLAVEAVVNLQPGFSLELQKPGRRETAIG